MTQNRKSFFERLIGNDEDVVEIPVDKKTPSVKKGGWNEESMEEGELTIDVYQTSDDIIVKTMVAGVKPEDVDISISRDMVTVKGNRAESHTVSEGDYFHRELYWGSFSRTVVLPQEVDVDGAEATERHGLLTIRLPKLDKSRQAKLKIRSN